MTGESQSALHLSCSAGQTTHNNSLAVKFNGTITSALAEESYDVSKLRWTRSKITALITSDDHLPLNCFRDPLFLSEVFTKDRKGHNKLNFKIQISVLTIHIRNVYDKVLSISICGYNK